MLNKDSKLYISTEFYGLIPFKIIIEDPLRLRLTHKSTDAGSEAQPAKARRTGGASSLPLGLSDSPTFPTRAFTGR